MLDIRWIRDNPKRFDQAMEKRNIPPCSETILKLDQNRRRAQTHAQEIQAERNKIAQEIGYKKSKKEDASHLIEAVSQSKIKQAQAEEKAQEALQELNNYLANIPNILMDDVPLGKDDSENQEYDTYGNPPSFSFPPKNHSEIGERLGMMDFERAAKLSGARFVLLSGDIVRLERAIATFMLDLHVQEFGYQEISTPVLVREKTLFGSGQLPKFKDDLFQTTDNRWLIPTAEVTLTNLYADEILEAEKLPLRLTALTMCFRSEAGSAGKDTKGMIRQHQFNKVELVSFSHPKQSLEELERMTHCATEVLRRLELPYRVVTLCSGSTGFCAQKTYDIEVWLPAQNCYREISSCSLCGDFQARRMNTRSRAKGEKQTQFLHTLNGSGLAVGRTLIAILENYQQEDGSVRIPDALRPYMKGSKVIHPIAVT